MQSNTYGNAKKDSTCICVGKSSIHYLREQLYYLQGLLQTTSLAIALQTWQSTFEQYTMIRHLLGMPRVSRSERDFISLSSSAL